MVTSTFFQKMPTVKPNFYKEDLILIGLFKQEPPKAVELKINVRSPVSRPAIMLQTKREENGVNGDSGEGSTEEVSSGGESPEANADAGRSPQFLLEKAPQPTPRLTREVNIKFLN